MQEEVVGFLCVPPGWEGGATAGSGTILRMAVTPITPRNTGYTDSGGYTDSTKYIDSGGCTDSGGYTNYAVTRGYLRAVTRG